jgi:glutamate synthase (NADPH/NADH) small chain
MTFDANHDSAAGAHAAAIPATLAPTPRLKPSERVKIPRQDSIEQDPEVRARAFCEVSSGLDVERALLEAQRCIECPKSPCVEGCPVGVDIPGFIRLLLQGDVAGAVARIRDANALPAICGRVCPQETQCEERCTLAKKFDPVAIGKLERFAADWEAEHVPIGPRRSPREHAEKVAVVGSGPAGLTCAADLARAGFAVTVFEALHAAGGVLRYGIPEFRLPRTVLDAELRRLEALGVEIWPDFLVGRTATLDELFDEWGYSAVFLATGAGTPTFMGIPGESLSGVYSANEFLTRVNLMGAGRLTAADTPVKCGRRVAVIGGGNTAMDAVRTARRLGAEHATLVYRRSRTEMPARVEEVHHAEEEGVEFLFLTSPVRIEGDEQGWVTGLVCQRMELGEPDASGRRRPVPVAGSEFVLPVETVIEAIGQKPNPIIQSTTPGLKTGRAGIVVVGERQETSREGVFAGGDLARGGATVILAMRDGRRAAAAIRDHLVAQRPPEPVEDAP